MPSTTAAFAESSIVRNPEIQETETPIRDVWALAKRRKWLIGFIVLLGACLGYGLSQLQTPIYGANVRILVEGRTKENQGATTADPVLNELALTAASYDVASQIEVLESQQILVDAYQEVGLPLSSELLNPDSPERISVKQFGNTNVLEITVTSKDSDAAVKLAEAVPTVYRAYLRRITQSEVNNGITFLKGRLEEEQGRLKDAQAKLEAFRKQHKVLDVVAERSNQAEKVARASLTVTEATRMLSAKQAELAQLLATQRRTPKMIEVPTEQANTELEMARRELSALRAQREQLLTQYLEDSENVRRVDALIAQQQQYINNLPSMANRTMKTRNPLYDSLEGRIAEARAEVKAAEAQVASASRTSEQSDRNVQDFTTIQRDLEDLQRGVDDRVQSVQTITKNIEALRLRSKTVRDPVQDITPVTKASLVQPRVSRNIVLGLLLGVFAAIGAALWRDHADDRIFSTHEAYALTGLDGIGFIPQLKTAGPKQLPAGRSNGKASTALEKSTRPAVSGRDSTLVPYQQLRSNVEFAMGDHVIQTLVVTSPSPGDGKSFVAAHLGLSSAGPKRRILLVDTYFRRPAQHERFGKALAPGLAEVLEGTHQLDDVVQETEYEGLMLLPAGMIEGPTPDALGSERMREVHDEMRSKYDFVVFDAPPTSRAIDSQILASLADGVVVVVQTGNTRRSSMRYGLAVLQKANARVLGLVFNKVKVNDDNVPIE